MKKYVLLVGGILAIVASCKKSASLSEQDFPYGKWVSIAFLSDEGNWTPDPMPHYWDFNADKNHSSFSFRDQNGAACSGEYDLFTPINSYTQFDFRNQTCGLTSRVIESFQPDTLVLRVLTPPNITKETVKYRRVE